MRGARQRPRDHDDEKPAACPEAINKRPAAGVHHAIGGEKGNLEPGEIRVAEWNLLLDGGNRNRQRLTIQVADGNRHTEDEGNTPAH